MDIQVRNDSGRLSRILREPTWIHILAVVAILHLLGVAVLFSRRSGGTDGAGGLRWGFEVNEEEATHSSLPNDPDPPQDAGTQPKPKEPPGVLRSLVSLLNKDDRHDSPPRAPKTAKLAPPKRLAMPGRPDGQGKATAGGLPSGGTRPMPMAFQKEGGLGRIVGIGGYGGGGTGGGLGLSSGGDTRGPGSARAGSAAFTPPAKWESSAEAHRRMTALLKSGDFDTYNAASILMGPLAASGRHSSGLGMKDIGGSERGTLTGASEARSTGGGAGSTIDLAFGAPQNNDGAKDGSPAIGGAVPGSTTGGSTTGGSASGGMGNQAAMAEIARTYTNEYSGYAAIMLERAQLMSTPYYGASGRALDWIDMVVSKAHADAGGWFDKKYPETLETLLSVLLAKDENTGVEIGPRQMLAHARILLEPRKVRAEASPDSKGATEFLGNAKAKMRLRPAAHDSLAEIISNTELWYGTVHAPLSDDCAAAMAAMKNGAIVPLPCQDLKKLEEAMVGSNGYLWLLRKARDEVNKPLWSYLGEGGERDVASIMLSHALTTESLTHWLARYKRSKAHSGGDSYMDQWQMPACRGEAFENRLAATLLIMKSVNQELKNAATLPNVEERAQSFVEANKMLVDSIWKTRKALDVVIKTECPKGIVDD